MQESTFTFTESTLTTTDGLALYTQSWSVADPQATVAIVHGIAEHSGRYRHVGNYLAMRGYTVHAFDLRGHGQSPGKRILFHHIDEHSEDVGEFLQWVQSQKGEEPLFLVGHSMGGLVVTYHVLTASPALRGVILSAPALKLNEVSPALVAVARVLAKVLPTTPVQQLDFTAISRDPVVVAENQNDPLVYHGGIPAATGLAFQNAVTYVQQHLAEFCLPLLLLHGTADRMVMPEASQLLYAQAASTDKTLRQYDGLYHEVFNEPEQAEILAEVVAWLDARV